ncbi:MAG: DUF1499 domain-containing protein [Marinomonas foliarum]|jgi:uncharacterized protein (DUF1499 family)|uniref:DUF1499 domain-containing protein n=1 Tax=Marinomonas foliarum TaxID=491950 RepID=A0A369AHE3_9GAMM|nr:DUF1499 domain-containing protein [Marinomonas foliarum]QRV23254.1 DUF1499 domain-containing protein [Marinomonas foliarum]RCX08792.1 uncharacterized protein (DUF1499 family) [Marinomonas foliarum]
MVRWIIGLVVALVIGFGIYVSIGNKLPEGLGLTDGFLKACPSSPNCVSTQASEDDEVHYAEPIIYTSDRKSAQLAIESYLLGQGSTRIIASTLGYVHFEVKSSLIGYVDDVEVYLPDADSVIHVRSASRVGYSDFGVNRDRVRQMKELLVD